MRISVFGALVGVLCLITRFAHAASNALMADPAVPPGITLQVYIPGGMPAGGIRGYMKVQLNPYVGDDVGRALYVRDDGKACTESCEKWTPLRADAGAGGAVDWSVVGGQWRYKDWPVYRFADDTQAGEIRGPVSDGTWRLLNLAPALDGEVAPAAVGVQASPLAGGDVLVDARGRTLYFFADAKGKEISCADRCLDAWVPLFAAQVAKPVGKWTVRTLADGSKQWAYKNLPLYTYAGDINAGMVSGKNADKFRHPAVVRSYGFPEGFATNSDQDGRATLTVNGLTVYAREQFVYSPGGHSTNSSSALVPDVGRAFGTSSCDAVCEKSWKPVLASKRAMPIGYWTLMERADGRRQWAYRGYALYSFVKDSQPGDQFGRDFFNLTDGANANFWRVAIP